MEGTRRARGPAASEGHPAPELSSRAYWTDYQRAKDDARPTHAPARRHSTRSVLRSANARTEQMSLPRPTSTHWVNLVATSVSSPRGTSRAGVPVQMWPWEIDQVRSLLSRGEPGSEAIQDL